MLYIFHGDDINNILAQRALFLSKLKEKKAELEIIKIEASDLSETMLIELVSKAGLFEPVVAVQLDGALLDVGTQKIVIEHIEKIENSSNVFLFTEHSVIQEKILKQFKGRAKKIYLNKTDHKEVDTHKNKSSIFSLADALGNRDRKMLWTKTLLALERGAQPEEVHGVMFWQIKTILLAKGCMSAREAGLSPFVFNNAKKFGEKWSSERLIEVAAVLVEMYHRSHKGEVEFSVALEKFSLQV